MGAGIALLDPGTNELDWLPEGWEVKVAPTVEPTVVGTGRLLETDEKRGEVTAIVGVTGIVDHVGDLIEPGAYSDTLAKRRPKVCWAHDWEKPVGKVLHIEEWLPGDPRFAQVGATLDGKAWPVAAGALVARMQMNLKSERGRETFAAVQFYSETDECEWSIGWQTVPQQTKRRSDGVRVCKKVELYEMSPVLFGAAPLTRTLNVKSIRLGEAWANRLGKAYGAPPATGPAEGEDDDAAGDEATLHRLGMPEVDWDEVDAAVDAADDAETPQTPQTPPPAAGPAETETKARPADDPAAVDRVLRLSKETLEAALIPDEHGLPNLELLAGLQIKAEGGADQNRGGAEELRRWYVSGEGAAKIGWGTPGAFTRCVAIAGKHMTDERAKGYCNLRNKDATGHYAGANGHKGHPAAEALAKTWNPLLEVGRDAAHTERKSYEGIRGSYEERTTMLRQALTEKMRERHMPSQSDSPDGEVSGSHGWVSIDGTWDDHVIATWYAGGMDDVAPRHYRARYSIDGDDVTIGRLERVELQTVVTSEMDEDGDVDALVLSLDSGVLAVKSMLAAPEAKAGRVLSEANVTRLRGALEHLLAVARAAGVHVTGDAEAPPASAITPDTTAAPATATSGTPAALSTKSARIDLAADLAALGLGID